MAKIYIEPAKAKLTLSQQQALERTLQVLSQDVGSIRSGLDYRISGREAIDARLRDAIKQIDKETDSTKSLRTGLEQIVARYEQTENGNIGRVEAEKTSIQSAANTGSTQQVDNAADSSESPELDLGKLLKDEIFKLLGPIGIVASGVEKWWDGDSVGVATSFIKLLGKGAKTMLDKPSAEWFESLFGWSKAGLKKSTEAPDFWSEIADFSSQGKTVGTVANWATSFLDSYVKNTEEGLTGGRFWGETLTEMGIGLFKTAAITAVVGAAMGSAPVLAVTAATVAVTAVVDWGLNKFVYLLTDGAQSEWVEGLSDLICDTTEKIIDAVGPVVTKVIDKGKEVIDKGVEIVKDAGQVVADAFDKGVAWVKGLFGGGKSKAAAGGGSW